MTKNDDSDIIKEPLFFFFYKKEIFIKKAKLPSTGSMQRNDQSRPTKKKQTNKTHKNL
jgi:hypothetical protein